MAIMPVIFLDNSSNISFPTLHQQREGGYFGQKPTGDVLARAASLNSSGFRCQSKLNVEFINAQLNFDNILDHPISGISTRYTKKIFMTVHSQLNVCQLGTQSHYILVDSHENIGDLP